MGFKLDSGSIKGMKGALRRKITELKTVRIYPSFFIREPRFLVALPSLSSPQRMDVKYPLLEPYAYAHIVWDNEKKKVLYSVVEPELTKDEEAVLKKLEASLTESIDAKFSSFTDRSKSIDYIEKKVKKILVETGLDIPLHLYGRLMYFIYRDFVGLNEIEPLMHDPYIEDVGCSGMDTPIYIIHKKLGSIETNIVFRDFDYLGNFVIKLSERCDRYISYAKPLLDGALPDGSRVQASLAKDVTTKGPTFSIRKFRRNPFSPVDMVSLNTADSTMMSYLWFVIERGISTLICGGVSTGKTSMLNALTMFIPPEKKIISIEDTRELNMPHDNWIPSVSRTGYGGTDSEGRRHGEIKLFDLLKESFRQNPDYVIVGEVRGEETYVMFQGMSSGHPSMSTMHAGSLDDFVKRLEAPPIELSPSLIESLDLVIIMVNAREKGKSSRRVKEIHEIESVDYTTGKVYTSRVFNWVPVSDEHKEFLSESKLLRKISFELGIPYQEIVEEVGRRKRFLEWMGKNGIADFKEVCELINLYYKDKDTVMVWVEKDIRPKFSKKAASDLLTSATGLRSEAL